ncbi:MAG: twin-arginine translocation signal domain-containing protein, partial [Gammaproteobacteria bacterium]|nr:twin-arginine translocation signal domain-containing protein [Gammaproteobacteria bacterium]
MADDDTFYGLLRAHGVTRRSFLKFCGLTAAALGLQPIMADRIAYA